MKKGKKESRIKKSKKKKKVLLLNFQYEAGHVTNERVKILVNSYCRKLDGRRVKECKLWLTLALETWERQSCGRERKTRKGKVVGGKGK